MRSILNRIASDDRPFGVFFDESSEGFGESDSFGGMGYGDSSEGFGSDAWGTPGIGMGGYSSSTGAAGGYGEEGYSYGGYAVAPEDAAYSHSYGRSDMDAVGAQMAAMGLLPDDPVSFEDLGLQLNAPSTWGSDAASLAHAEQEAFGYSGVEDYGFSDFAMDALGYAAPMALGMTLGPLGAVLGTLGTKGINAAIGKTSGMATNIGINALGTMTGLPAPALAIAGNLAGKAVGKSMAGAEYGAPDAENYGMESGSESSVGGYSADAYGMGKSAPGIGDSMRSLFSVQAQNTGDSSFMGMLPMLMGPNTGSSYSRGSGNEAGGWPSKYGRTKPSVPLRGNMGARRTLWG